MINKVEEFIELHANLIKDIKSLAISKEAKDEAFPVLYVKIPFGLSLEQKDKLIIALGKPFSGVIPELFEEYPKDIPLEILWESIQE